MEPINTIALTLIFGLEMFVLGIDNKRNWQKLFGMIVMCIGWIWNMVVILSK